MELEDIELEIKALRDRRDSISKAIEEAEKASAVAILPSVKSGLMAKAKKLDETLERIVEKLYWFIQYKNLLTENRR